MSLLGGVLSQSAGVLISVLGYIAWFKAHLKKYLSAIKEYEKKQSGKLDKDYLEGKTMRSQEFLSYHRKIHNIEKEVADFYLYGFVARWSGIVFIASLVIDGVLEFLAPVMGYPYPFQLLIYLVFFNSALLFGIFWLLMFASKKEM